MNSKTWYSYDEQGRSTWTIKAIYGMAGGATKYFTEDYVYDSEGNVVKSIFQKNTPAETFVHYYEYDVNDRLYQAYTNTVDNPGTKTLQARYEYFLHGPVKRVEIAGNLQGIDYTYTLDGQLKAINHSKKAMDPGKDGMTHIPDNPNAGFLPDAFGEVLEYYDNDFISNTLIGTTSSGGSGGNTVLADLVVNNHNANTTVYQATNSITFTDGFNSNGNSFTTQLGVPASTGGSEDATTPAYNISVAVNNADAPPQYGGQIRGMSWFSKKPPMAGVSETPNMYAYKYDEKYRFNTATWGTISNNSFSGQAGVNGETIPANTGGYDKHGNILALSRTGQAGTVLDNFSYQYYQSPKPTNKLQTITQQTMGQAYATYQYDELGQLTGEIPGPAYGSAPAKYIAYNVEGLVTAVFSDANKTLPLVRYVYDELGARIKKISYNGSGAVVKTTYYIGGIVYEQELGQPTPLQTEVAINAGGRVGVYFRQGNAYRYEMQDHLGNVRAVFVKTSTGTADYVVFRDYYPFGMEIGGRNYTDAQGYRYGYQGKYAEKDPETGWNAFELRMYDSRVGRWLTVDPEGEFFSPYVGMGNDPGNKTDPTGGKSDNEYTVYKSGGNTVRTVYTGNKGGNKVDHITEIDLDKGPRFDAIKKYTIDVNIQYVSGPGNEFAQADNPTPGFRERHGFSTEMWALEMLAPGAKAGTKISKKLFATPVVERVVKSGLTFTAKGVIRPFTASNFRTNLGRLTANIPANSQAHHIFAQKYRSFFNRAGLDIHDPKFGVWWETAAHLKNAAGYNAKWADFFRLNPNATQSQILNQGRTMMQQYGISVSF